MKRRLYLLRHAKSSWGDPGLADHDRPLAKRGRRAAKAIGRHLADEGIEPELVLCSSARRARETLDRMKPPPSDAVRVEPELYGAGPAELLALLRELPDELGSVMLVGHNPGLQDLALELARPGPERRELEAKFPTGALATLAFPGPGWRALHRGDAELIAFVRPRDLERG